MCCPLVILHPLASPPKYSLEFQDCKWSHGWRDDFLIPVEALRICLCERSNILLEGYLSVCPILNHIAFDFSSMMIPRQPPLAILTCLNLWVVGKQFFWCYSSPSQRPRSLVEECLTLIDVIWTPGRGIEKFWGKSLRSEIPSLTLPAPSLFCIPFRATHSE